MAIWARDFDNRKRHCWDYGKGQIMEGTLDTKCIVDHSDDPKIVGKVEWMRFIHEFEDVVGRENDVFLASDVGGHLNFNPDAETSEGDVAFAEEYYDANDKLVMRVFLISHKGWARIECYDPALFGACDETYARVQDSYMKVTA